MPPFWSLGFQLCRYGYENIENLTKVVDRMLASDIPYVSFFFIPSSNLILNQFYFLEII